MKQAENNAQTIDKANILGLCISTLCIIHCILTPIAISLISIKFSHIYAWLDIIFVVLAFIVVWYVAPKTHKRWIKFLLWGGVVIFSIGLILESFLHTHSLLYAGSGMLVFAHISHFFHK